MSEDSRLLVTLDEVWAKMFMEVLKDNGIPSTSMPVFGFAFSAKTGVPESSRIYVPDIYMERAKDLLEEVFSGDGEEALSELFPEEENER